MVIQKISIKSFGQLTNTNIEFSNSVNVIEGQNEAGKSTIAAFIKYMLYGFDATESDDVISERKKRINWDTGIAEGSMNVIVKGREYLITRSTVLSENGGRTTYKEDSSIIDLENGTPAFGKLPAGEVFFGVDKELFENTAFVGQIGDTAFREGTVKQSIENILFSGNERINTQRASNQIAEKMETLLHQGNTGGAIIELMRKEEELEERLRRTDEDNKQILAKEAELHEIRSKREEAEDKRDKLLDLDMCYRNVMLIQTFDKLHELEDECAAKTEAYNSYIKENTKGDFVPDDSYLADLSSARRGTADSYENLVMAKERYEKEKSAVGITREISSAIELADSFGGEGEVSARISANTKNKIKCMAGGIVAILAFVASIVFAVAAKDAATFAKIAVGFLGVLSLIGAGVLAYYYLDSQKNLNGLTEKFGAESVEALKTKLDVIAKARFKRDTIIDNTESARAALDLAKEKYDRARAELMRVILLFGEQPPLSELDSYLDTLDARVREFLSEKRRLLDEKSTIEITVKEIRRTLSDKSEIDIRAQVSPLKRKVLEKINYDEIINGIADAKTIIEEQRRLSFGVENELSSLKARATDPGELYSKIQALDAKINQLKAKHKAYFVALRAVSTASESLREEVSPRIGEYATELLSVMTDKKYSSLKIDEALKVNFETEPARARSVDYLSGGTRDLTYIAVRMALVDMLFSERPPICFDETFASQDNSRAASMMNGIKQLSEDGYQSFIFTCRAREGALAKEKISDAGVYRISVMTE